MSDATAILVGAALIAAATFGGLVYLGKDVSADRYQIVSGNHDVATLLDKKTGEARVISVDRAP